MIRRVSTMTRSHTTTVDPPSRWRSRAKQGLGFAGVGLLAALHTTPIPEEDSFLLRPQNPAVRIDDSGWGSTGAETPYHIENHLPGQESARTIARTT